MPVQKTKTFFVPFDFTELSEFAIDYAARMAKMIGYSVTIGNIITAESKAYFAHHNMDKTAVDNYLKKLARSKSIMHYTDISCVNKEGDMNSIGSLAEECGANFIVIGIEKPKKTTSKLLQIIGDAPVPTFVVQQKTDRPDIKNIIFPVDTTEKTRQKTGWTIRVAIRSKALVHIFAINVTEQYERTHQNATLKMIEKEFTDYDIKFKTSKAVGKQKDFPEELMTFAKANKGDLFVVMKTPTTRFSSLFYSPADLKIIMNELKIPCLCINPRDIGKMVVGL